MTLPTGCTHNGVGVECPNAVFDLLEAEGWLDKLQPETPEIMLPTNTIEGAKSIGNRMIPGDGSTSYYDVIQAAPHKSDCSKAIGEGQICWDNDDLALYVGNGTKVIKIPSDGPLFGWKVVEHQYQPLQSGLLIFAFLGWILFAVTLGALFNKGKDHAQNAAQ